MVVDELKSYAASKGKQLLVTFNGYGCAKHSSTYAQYPILLQSNDYFTCVIDATDFNLAINPSLKPVEDFAWN
jgi:hypothetical protein